jgi:membrane protein required for colicin V production
MKTISFFNVLDYVYIGIMFISSTFGYISGLTKVLTGSIAWLASGFFATMAAPLFHSFVMKYIKSEVLAAKASVALAYVIILAVLLLLSGLISEKIKQSALSSLDRSFGLLAGLLRGVMVPMAISCVFLIFAIPNDKFELTANSRISRILYDIADEANIYGGARMPPHHGEAFPGSGFAKPEMGLHRTISAGRPVNRRISARKISGLPITPRIIRRPKGIRLLSKQRYFEEFIGAHGAQDRSVHVVHEDPSTEATQKLPKERMFRKKSSTVVPKQR